MIATMVSESVQKRILLAEEEREGKGELVRAIHRKETLTTLMSDAQQSGSTLPLTLFWGPHPERSDVNQADAKTLTEITGFFGRLGIQFHITVILADAHGEFNGINNFSYLSSVEELVREKLGPKGKGVWLSQLYEKYRLTNKREELDRLDCYDLRECDVLSKALLRGAEHRGQGPEDAVRYTALRIQEAELINDLTRGGVFLVIGGYEYLPLFTGVESPILFIRGKAKSGAGFQPEAPWIPIRRH